MSNNLNNINAAASVLAKGAAQILADEMVFCKSIDKVDTSDFDGKNGFSAGNKLSASIPARYIPQSGSFDISSTNADSVEEKVSMSLDLIQTLRLDFGTQELATDVGLKSVMTRFVAPAAKSIAQYTEQEIIKRATQATYNTMGTPGSTAFSLDDIQSVKQRLDQTLAPQSERNLLVNSSMMGAAVSSRKGYFADSSSLSKQYKEGVMVHTEGFDWYNNEMIYNHTNGADVTGVALTAIGVEGASTISVNGLTTSTTGIVKKGSVFTIAGVYRVHPTLKTVTSTLQQFVVTADANSDGSGNATLNISPALYTATSRGLQNISALPASSAAVTFVGSASTSYNQGLAFHPSAFRLATVPLEMPTAVEFTAQETVDGITVSIVRAFDVVQRRWITRLDLLGGFMAVRPDWACRITA